MASFSPNGSEITTWMGYNFKTKSKITKSQATILRKTSFFHFQAEDHQISTKTLKLHTNLIISYFYSYTYEKTSLAVHFTKECFFCQFVGMKVTLWVQCQSIYYLLTVDTSDVSIFSLTGWPTKMSLFFFGNNFYKNKETFKTFSKVTANLWNSFRGNFLKES